MLSRMCVSRYVLNSTQSFKSPVSKFCTPRNNVVRTFSREERDRFRMESRNPTLWEKAMGPPGPNAFGMGKGALAGASLVGLGALCFYGTSSKGTLQQSHLWPQYVKERIQTTYMYIAGSLVITATSAISVFQTPRLLHMVSHNGWISIMATMALMIGSGMVVRGMEYKPGFGSKQIAWMVHTGIMGAVIAPICFLGGPILSRAAMYTAGVVGGLSTLAMCAPSGEFLSLRAPLAMGLGMVFASSFAGMFLPPTTKIGAGLLSFSLYGGLILFSAFLLYDTQAIVKRAEIHPPPGMAYQPFDPINSAISVYLDVLNIFMRLALILSGGGGNQRRKIYASSMTPTPVISLYGTADYMRYVAPCWSWSVSAEHVARREDKR